MTDSLCECGHRQVTHYPENGWTDPKGGMKMVTTGPCHATVYTKVDHGPLTSGMNATRCKCQKWEPRSCAACSGDPEAHGMHVCGRADGN